MTTTVLAPAFLITVAVIAAHAAYAAPTEADNKTAPTSVQANETTYRELAALRTQNALLTEKLKIAELQSKVDAAKGISAPAPAGSSRASQAVTTYIDAGARVLMVAGATGQLVATIQFSNGGNTVGRVGTHIPSLGIVKSIKTNEVLIENGKELISVPFASEPIGNAAQYAAPYSPQPPSNAMVPSVSLLPPGPVGRN